MVLLYWGLGHMPCKVALGVISGIPFLQYKEIKAQRGTGAARDPTTPE